MYVSFGHYDSGYDYSYDPERMEKYCEHCGISVKWYSMFCEIEWQTFDTRTGKKYLYEVCLCPSDKKRQELEQERKLNASTLERVWLKIIHTKPKFHVGYSFTTPYYRRYLQSNLEVVEEEHHGT